MKTYNLSAMARATFMSIISLAISAFICGCAAFTPPGTPEDRMNLAFLKDAYLKAGSDLKDTKRSMLIKPGRYKMEFLNMDGSEITLWSGTFDLRAGRTYERMYEPQDAAGYHTIPQLLEHLTPRTTLEIPGTLKELKNLGRFTKEPLR